MRSARLLLAGLLGLLPLVLAAGCDDDPAPGPQTPPQVDGSTPVPDGGGAGDARVDGRGPNGEGGAPTAILGPRDRVGRPFVTRILVGASRREAYNGAPPDFVLPTDPGGDAGSFGADFQAALALLDGLDGTDAWDGGAGQAGPDDAGVFPHPLVGPWISADALLVDPDKPFTASSYLDIEANGDGHTSCGGRWLGDDALDKTLSFLVKKNRTGVSDGVAAPAKPPSMTFPYLAAPF